MSDDAIAVYHYKTGNKVLSPSRQLTNSEMTELFRIMEMQVSPELYELLSSGLKLQFKETKPITHPIYRQD